MISPKILFVVNRLDYGGAEIYVLSIANLLAERGYDIYIASSGGALVERLHPKITHHTIATDTKTITGILKTAWSLQGIIKKNNILILHANSVVTACMAKIGCYFTSAKVITTVHSWGTNKSSFSAKAVNNASTKVIAVSHATAQEYINHGLPPHKIVVIHNGIDPSRFEKTDKEKTRSSLREQLGIPQDVSVIINVARMEEKRKGHHHLLQAFRELLQHHPKCKLLLVGDGQYKETYEAFCQQPVEDPDIWQEKHGNTPCPLIQDYVLFLGTRNDVPELLMASDIFCLLSEWEGLPLVIAEAMICGLPVIASCVSGVPELVQDNETGFLFEPTAYKDIASKLCLLLEDRERYTTMSAQSQKRAYDMFTLEKMVSNMEELYHSLLIK